ncbi:Fic family protein [Chitinophaga tropicalis]|uniref:Fic family protein n=1 Tax=Chitinophaga tropicalis TaxID=2683588 RepID=A0A7K1UB06_9BACT|nr:Fic family protein [Chitinophaga tropicalis]MVT11543.1 Fic family protein [Chitinophaga tropicalis]
MSKQLKHELNLIEDALKNFRQGASIEDIRTLVGMELRTLQRRLKALASQGRIRISGQRKGTLYHPQKPTLNISATEIEIVPLSPEGNEIRAIIAQPSAKRRPVGYNIDFLTDYRPNVDSYLTAEDKARLAELGKTANLNQPAGTYTKEILQRLLIDLSWNSSRLEGNTYSLLDTQRLISQGQEADNKTAAEAQMILNHKDAIEFIVQGGEEIGFNRYTLTNLHGLLSNNLLPDPAASGRLRGIAVGITNSVFIPLGIPQQIEEMFELLLHKAEQIENPFEQAFFAMVQLPYLQPFDDVNKRVSRLAANIPLSKHNLSPLAFVDVPNDIYVQGIMGIYELNRIELFKDVFMWAYERSAQRYAALRQSLGEPDPFRLKYRDIIKELIGRIVTEALPAQETNDAIRQEATRLPQADQEKFFEVVATELLSLHEGNFARYRVRPSEFKKWQQVWKGLK